MMRNSETLVCNNTETLQTQCCVRLKQQKPDSSIRDEETTKHRKAFSVCLPPRSRHLFFQTTLIQILPSESDLAADY